MQFYDDESFLFDVVGGFLADGLRRGERVVAIATAEHCRAFAASVRARGVDADAIAFHDAAGLMSVFMHGSMPDEQRFLSSVAGLFEEAMSVSPHARIRVYGEMVDLLWRDGRADAAIRLEELWNGLAPLYPFSLLCAYPLGNFHRESDAQRFASVCAAHAHVLPAESYTSDASDDTRLREIAALQQRAAALEAEIEHRRKLEHALREAARTKDEFLATLSHELRTPLTAILGWARLMAGGTLDQETARTAIETIERSAQSQAALVDDILDISRIVRGKLTLRSKPVDLRMPVRNAVETLRLAADSRDIRLEVDQPDDPCIVSGDATRLQQIAWNLLSNAVKFSPRGSSVSIAVAPNHERVHLVVRDSGQGIDAGFLPHLFEPFRQADGATTRRHNGLGLGLAIVKHLVEAHGGTIRAASGGEGQGATFTVALPLASTA